MKQNIIKPLTGLAIVSTVLVFSSSESEAAEWIITETTKQVDRAHQLDVGSILNFDSAFTPGVLYGLPIAPDGLISSLNDSLYLEFGSFLRTMFGSLGPHVSLIPVVGARWNFHLTPDWTVFSALRMGPAFALTDFAVGGLYIDGSLGARWHASDTLDLRLETFGGRFGGGILVGAGFTL